MNSVHSATSLHSSKTFEPILLWPAKGQQFIIIFLQQFIHVSPVHDANFCVSLKVKKVWQKKYPLVFQLILRCLRDWRQLSLDSE